MDFKFTKLAMPEVILIEPPIHKDERGFFTNIYRKKDFAEVGIKEDFVVDACSKSKKEVIRGLHFQEYPFEYARLLRVGAGKIFDIVVDIRKESPNFSKHISIILSADNERELYIPKGFAHGFYTISDYSEVIYKFSNYHSPAHDKGIIWNDPTINIKWPITNPILSKRDQNFPTLEKAIIEFGI